MADQIDKRVVAHEALIQLLIVKEMLRDPHFADFLRKDFDSSLGINIGEPMFQKTDVIADIRAIFMDTVSVASRGVAKFRQTQATQTQAARLSLRRRFLNWLERG
jgi:hypothetical protein